MSDAVSADFNTESSSTSRRRLDVVDLARGLVMVIMSLDHLRDYLQAEQISPTNLSETTVSLFLTRWITHFCAPVFMLLAGVGISLGLSSGKSKWEQARFTFVRGVWLIFLEVTIVHVSWSFNFQLTPVFALVIWAIGWSMVVLSLLIFLPEWMLAGMGIILIVCHNAFDKVQSSDLGPFGSLWIFLHTGGLVTLGNIPIFVGYPLVPWVGVMAAGIGFGKLLKLPPAVRSGSIMRLGLAMIAIFAVLRGGNLYGDPNPWTRQASPIMTALSIMNCSKYPPSLSYLLMTLGLTFTMWPLLERWRGRLARIIITFGRVPLFFYIVHILVVHALALVVVYAQVGTLPDWLFSFPRGKAAPGCGVTLPVLYLVWIGVVAFLYPICRWYGMLKNRYPNSLLRFL